VLRQPGTALLRSVDLSLATERGSIVAQLPLSFLLHFMPRKEGAHFAERLWAGGWEKFRRDLSGLDALFLARRRDARKVFVPESWNLSFLPRRGMQGAIPRTCIRGGAISPGAAPSEAPGGQRGRARRCSPGVHVTASARTAC
jgi:hypothetical protein